LSTKLGAIFSIIGLIFGYEEVWGADWKLYGWSTEKVYEARGNQPSHTILGSELVTKDKAAYSRYYDRESTIRPFKDVVSVWERSIYLKERGGWKLNLYEIDCSKREYKTLKSTEYDKNGKNIQSSDLG